MAQMARKTYSLSPPVAGDVSAIASKLGISESAVVEHLLVEACPIMLEFLDTLPTEPFPESETLRYRGDSIKVIESRISKITAGINAFKQGA